MNQQIPCFGTEEEYKEHMQGRCFHIVGLTTQKGSLLNGKLCVHVGVQYQPMVRVLVKIVGDETIYKIKPRNLVPEGYTLKTIHSPYQVMTLAEEQETDKQIVAAQRSPNKQKDWKLCFKYVGPQKNYCFSCQQFGTACYDYCGYCGVDFMGYLHVQKLKLMTCYKGCQDCMLGRGKDINLVGKCQDCWNNKGFSVVTNEGLNSQTQA